jgi:histidinol-phosphate aminotransferase
MSRRKFFAQSLAFGGAALLRPINTYASSMKTSEISEINILKNKSFEQSISDKALIYNESAIGPSPRVIDCLANFPQVLSQYHSLIVTRNQLRYEISRKENVPENWVSLWSGSRQFLRQMTTALCISDFQLITNWPEYQKPHERAVELGRKPIKLKQTKNMAVDLNGALEHFRKNPKSLFYFSNPNLPFGKFLSQKELIAFFEQAPKSVYFLVDECYIEFLGKDFKQKSVVSLIERFPNIMVNRTFSKIYGLASARIGYAICHPSTFRKFIPDRENEETCLTSISAVLATVALRDQEHIEHHREKVKEIKEIVLQFAKERKLATTGEHGNFICLLFEPGRIERDKLKKSKFRFSSNDHAGLFYVRLSCKNSEGVRHFLEEIEAAMIST